MSFESTPDDESVVEALEPPQIVAGGAYTSFSDIAYLDPNGSPFTLIARHQKPKKWVWQ